MNPRSIEATISFKHTTYRINAKENADHSAEGELTAFNESGDAFSIGKVVHDADDAYELVIASLVLCAQKLDMNHLSAKERARSSYTQEQRAFARVINDDTPDRPSRRQRRHMKKMEGR